MIGAGMTMYDVDRYENASQLFMIYLQIYTQYTKINTNNSFFCAKRIRLYTIVRVVIRPPNKNINWLD